MTGTPPRLAIGVLGTGAIGTVFAALLCEAGHRVSVTARQESIATIQADGLRLHGVLGEHSGRPRALARLDGRDDVVLVCTKAQDAEQAIRENAAALEGRTVVVVQNGLDGLDTLRRVAPRARPVGALVLFASSLTGPGSATVTGPGETYLGTPSESGGELDMVETVLAPLLPVRRVDDFRGAQWTKLVVNELNALAAATGLTIQQTIADPGLRLVTTEAMRECVRAGIARGIRFGALQGLDDARLRVFAALPLVAGAIVPLTLAKRMGAVPNPGSTLQSVLRGQRTEIDHLTGAVVREAVIAGVPAPINELLLDLVHDVESGASFRTRDEVLARVAGIDRDPVSPRPPAA